jgi:hypothetical protein
MDRESGVKRRDFLKGAGATVAVVAGGELLSLSMLKPASAATNPLAGYPNRDGRPSTATSTRTTTRSYSYALRTVPTTAT